MLNASVEEVKKAGLENIEAVIADMIPWLVSHRAEQDKWKNDVTILRTPDGKQYRMVHHSQPYHKKQRFTIYEGRNRFIKVFYTLPRDDTHEHSASAHRYTVTWDGMDNLGVTIDDSIGLGGHDDAELVEALKKIKGGHYFEVFLSVLNYVEVFNCWQSKAL